MHIVRTLTSEEDMETSVVPFAVTFILLSVHGGLAKEKHNKRILLQNVPGTDMHQFEVHLQQLENKYAQFQTEIQQLKNKTMLLETENTQLKHD